MSAPERRLAEGEWFYVGRDAIVIRRYPTPDAAYLVFEGHIQPGGGPPTLHTHTSSEFFCTIGGELTYFMAHPGPDVRAVSGTTAFVPGGVLHTYRNVAPHAARYLAVVSPGADLAAFFNEVAVLPEAERLRPADVTRIYRKYGTETEIDPTASL